MSRYLFLAQLTDAELQDVAHSALISERTRCVARLMLQIRAAYKAGDYYSAAEGIAAMRRAA